MNKRLLSGMFAAFLLVSGCSSNEEKVEDSKREQQNKEDLTENVKGDGEMDRVEVLDKVIEDAKVVKKSDYTEASYAEYKKAVDVAKVLKKDKKATQAEVDAAVKAVADAEKSLEKKEVDDQASAEAVTSVTNTKVAFGFTSVQGKYNAEQIDKIDFFVGDSPTPRTAELNADGTFSRDLASDVGQHLSFKAYKGSELVQEGEYTVE